MKVFLDTGVLLAALISNGVCHELLKALHTSHPDNMKPFTCVTSARVLAELKGLEELEGHEELERQSPSQYGWTSHDTQAAIRMFSEEYTIAPPALVALHGKDEEDGWMLADAQSAGCDYFISGDKEILALYSVDSMRIASPRELLLWLCTGKPIPRFEAHEDRALYLVTRLKSAHDLH